MEVKYSKNVRIICDLAIGDTVFTDEWGPNLDNREHTIEDIKASFGKEGAVKCQSGFLVKINNYPSYLDSAWLIKKEK